MNPGRRDPRDFDKGRGRMDENTRRELRRKQLCYTCKEPWDPSHKCMGRGKAHYCYPRYLGITRRSCLEAHMVLDMEYREQELPEHGPGGPFFSFSARFVLPAVPASITTGLGLYQRRLLLHEVIGPRYHGMCHI
jgi:hypothetical protein